MPLLCGRYAVANEIGGSCDKMLSIQDSCREIKNWAVQYAGDFPAIMFLSIAACIYFIFTSKSFRRKLLAPIVALVVLVLNPVMYSLLYGNNNLPFVSTYGLRYWRFFWLLPQAVLVSAFAMDLLRRTGRPVVRCLGLVVAAAIIILVGKNIYLDEKQFMPAESAYKVSPTVQKVCEVVLADEPEPLCMFDNVISTQAREISGSIRQLWGRNGVWNVIGDPEALEIYKCLQEKDREWETIFAYAEQRGVTHISFTVKKNEDQVQLRAVARQHGYDVLEIIDDKRFIWHRVSA